MGRDTLLRHSTTRGRMATNNPFIYTRQVTGYSSDSSVMSHDREQRFTARIQRPGWWLSFNSLTNTSNESLEHLCRQCHSRREHRGFQRMSNPMVSRSEDTRMMPYLRHFLRKLWVTEVISGTGFYAMSEQSKEKAAEMSALLAAELGDSYTAAQEVVPRMVCAVRINGKWERVMVKSICTSETCTVRMPVDEKETEGRNEYWHVFLMEAGTIKCVALADLALVTKQIALEAPKARLYFLRRIHQKDDESLNIEAKEWLKSKIQGNQMLVCEVFFRVTGKSRTHAEVYVDNMNISDEMVKAGYADYNYKNDQKFKGSDGAVCCSLQDVASISSRESHVTARYLKSDRGETSMPELMKLIDYLMRKRKDSVYLTYSGSALNHAIKSQASFRHHEMMCEHGHASLNKNQILLRRLKDESPFIYEVRELKDSLYENLVEMFEKWKSNYKAAQRKSDTAIEVIANIFLTFTNRHSSMVKYKYKCRKLEEALNNEVLLQNEGQDLAQMLVPAVATKIMSNIDRHSSEASGYMNALERPQTLHQFITNSKFISTIALETLAKDILKDLYHFHDRGIAYKHLHPENVLVRKGHATLRPIEEQQDCKIGEDWPFEGVEVANEALGQPGDVFNFGLLVLWMACKGADNYYDADMKFYCNVALIKMTMAEDPSQRPLVEAMVCTNNPIFRPNNQWRPMPLKNYLKEVFNDKCSTEEAEEGCDLHSGVETGDTTSESEIYYQQNTDDETENETTDSELPMEEHHCEEKPRDDDDNDSPVPEEDTEQPAEA